MDYEKLYKEAIERAREYWETDNDNTLDIKAKGTMEYLFPELVESEDERIRKELIEFVKSRGGFKQEYITWLEKQGKETSWKPSKEEMDVLYGLAYITNQYDEHKEEVITRLYQDLKREFFNGSSYENMFSTNTSTEDDVRRRSTIQVLEYARSLDTYNQYGKADIDKNIAWLEKQEGCEHIKKEWLEHIKQSWYKEGFIDGKYSGGTSKEWTINDTTTLNELIDFLENGTAKLQHDLTRYANWLKIQFTPIEKQSEQKSIDKVEPKFKVGQWITDGNITIQIEAIKNDCYLYCGDCALYSTKIADKVYHLWTIKDAKDGDVLSNGKMIVIFKHFEDPSYRKHIVAYIGLDNSGNIQITDDTWILGVGKAKPATKEQRDTLFAKMKEAGYEWDAEKKELKKIEQKPVEENKGNLGGISSNWSEGDERIISKILGICEDFKRSFRISPASSEIVQKDIDKINNWLKSLKDRVQPKQEWGEEDERNLQGIIDEIEANKNNAPDYDLATYDRFLSWLKSIKQRIGE